MFHVFAGSFYYPKGGANDLVFSSCKMEECWEFLAGKDFDWYQITDCELSILKQKGIE